MRFVRSGLAVCSPGVGVLIYPLCSGADLSSVPVHGTASSRWQGTRICVRECVYYLRVLYQ